MSIINGHNMRWRVEGATIAKATDCTISVSGDTRDTAHKDIGAGVGAGWSGAEYGTKSWEGSCSGLYAHGESYEELFEYFRTNAKIQVEFSDNIITHYKWTGTAVITSMEQNAPNNEDVTFSVSWKGDGALVLAAIVP